MIDSSELKDMANAIRFLSADAINKANSGHPGMPLGMADVATVLFSEFIKLNPTAPKWFDRDRFVLSAGHGSMLLYSLLYLMGYKDVSIDDIKNFRQFGAKTAGHPEYGHLDGVDMTTGPLGQGISSAVGMALAERVINKKYGASLCNHYTYVIAGDGCLMEGVSEEAISLAGHLGLNKLIVFWDNNNITIDGTVDKSSSTNQFERFNAVGWHTIDIDGHDYDAIRQAIQEAQKQDKPTLISCRTIIGYGSPSKSGTSKCHGSPLGAEETELMRKKLDWNYKPFEIPLDILNKWRQTQNRNLIKYNTWVQAASLEAEFRDFIANKLPLKWDDELNQLKKDALVEKTNVATRKASEMCLKRIVPHIPEIIGGSADLAASNLTFVDGLKTITKDDYSGNNIMYGIREHAMGAIMNGMALHGGVIPYAGTFFVFSDYMRPSMRLAALMGLRVIYVLTHDSIGVGEDGPTHQPIEHLASYRAMPNILTFRPADVIETAECWQIALTEEKRPSILALSRQNLPLLRTSADENLSSKGAYVISKSKAKRDATIIATGSEVSIAVEAQKILFEKGIDVAVVSMPCQELFEEQTLNYQLEVLGTSPVISVEAGTTFGWNRYAQKTIGIDMFGASAPSSKLYEHFAITPDDIVEEIEGLLS
ncbi:MAG: transketolase [Alphaproteobacteria bacterium]|nr:transketolase [Alphaproteobacteria bacterium]